MMTTAIPTAPGDRSYLASYLVGTYLFGSTIPPDQATGSPFSGTYEIYGDIGSMVFPAVVGDVGPPGPAAFALNLVTELIDDPADLPQTLTASTADIGKYWLLDDVDSSGNIIGASAYVWYGTSWRRIMFGTPGPPGPCPIITPTVGVIPPNQDSTITTGGTPLYPTWHMDLAVPAGPAGPAPALALCPDIDLNTNPPTPGDVLGYTGRTLTQHLAAPLDLAVSGTGGGGTLTAGTKYYVVTATSAAGETTISNEVSVTVIANATVHLSFEQVVGAAGYRIYRGTAAGGENILAGTITGYTTTTFTDTGAGGAATPPSANTATVTYAIWVPVSISQLIPSPYSMPENAFTSFSGLSQRAAIGSFVIPPQPFPWTPIVWGHIGAFGLELSATPLMIGCEVRLGDPTAGTLVSRGFGNELGEVNIMPHYSDPSNASVAITPTNGLGVVPANHSSPAEGTIYVNLYNDGEIGTYQFSPTDAQCFVMVVPVAEPASLLTSTIFTTGRTRRAQLPGRRR
jgi:hypothetical protein